MDYSPPASSVHGILQAGILELGAILFCRRSGFNPWVGKILWRREWLPTPVFLPGEFHGHRILAGYSLWGHKRVRHQSVTNTFTFTFFIVIIQIKKEKSTL